MTRIAPALLALGLAGLAGLACAASPAFCDRASPLTAREQDRLLRFAAVARDELERSGGRVALIARSGLNLQRFDIRYSHAGISLKASDNGPWSVRQLYYACDEGRPRLFDQGMAGFLFGTDDPAVGYLSMLVLPDAEAEAVERAALDNPRALRLLAATYSANAHPFSVRYQNCNQWVMELLASAWGELADAGDLRAQAQHWLATQGYAPRPVEVGSHALMFAAGFIPWIHLDDHPETDVFALRVQTSLPREIEAFVQARVRGVQRIELCHDSHRVVVHRGWEPVAEGCRPGTGDRVVALD